MNPDSFGKVPQNKQCEETKNFCNPLQERLKFTAYRFTEKRSFDEHVQYIKQQASKCDFGNDTEWLIIDKILKEYNDPEIIELLQEKQTVTLNTVIGLIRDKEKIKFLGIKDFFKIFKNFLNQEIPGVSKQLGNYRDVDVDSFKSYKKLSKESINEVINISLLNCHTLNEVQNILEVLFNCNLGQDDMNYVQRKYVEQLIELWLDEVSLNTIQNMSSPLQFLDDLINIQDFQACLRLALNAPYNKLFKDLLSHKADIFTDSLEKNCIRQFKSTTMTCLLLEASNIQNEITFLQRLIRSIKVSTNAVQILNLINATQYYDSVKNDKKCEEKENDKSLKKMTKAFKTFLQDVMNCSSAEIPILQLKDAARTIINQDEFFVVKHVQDTIRDYLKPVDVTETYKDGRMLLEISGKHIVLSEVFPRILRQRNCIEIEEVRIVQAGVVHINESLESSIWSGMNVVVLSETVIVSPDQKIIWNISGKHAVDKSSKADKESCRIGLDGEDGKPGESGGNALFICDEFENANNFQIIVNGGKGSKGQDGGKGRDGEDGDFISNFDFKKKFPAVSKYYDSYKLQNLEITRSSVMENLKSVQISSMGSLMSVSNDDFYDILENKMNPLSKSSDIYFEVETLTGCKILFSFYYGPLFTFCQSFLLHKGSDGKPGKPGGKGGRGGQGGFAGDVDFNVSNNCELIRELVLVCNIKGEDGKPGESGEPGKPGKNGQDCAYIDSTKMRKETLFLPQIQDSHKLSLKYHEESDENRVYCSHNGQYAEITKSKKNFYQTCNMNAPSTKFVGKVQQESVQAVRKKTINSKSVLAQYQFKTSAINCLVTDNFEHKIKQIYEQLLNKEEELLELTSKQSKISRKIQLYFDNQYELYQSPLSFTSEHTVPEYFSLKDQLMNINLPIDDSWNILSQAHISLMDFTILWDTINSQSVSLSENEVKFLIQGKYHLAVLEDLRCIEIDKFDDQKLNTCENMVGSVNHCLTLSNEKGPKPSSKIDGWLCEDSHEKRQFWINRVKEGECNRILVEIFLEKSHWFSSKSKFEQFKSQFSCQKKTKIKYMNCKLIPILSDLSKVKELHVKLVEAVTKKNIDAMIAVENDMYSDDLLHILFENYKRTVRAPLTLSSTLTSELRNIVVNDIENKGISSVFYREILARSFKTNILLYTENESNQMVLTHNHNPSVSVSVHFLMKNNMLFKLKLDEGLSKMNKVHKKKNEIYYKILLYLDSLVEKDQFDLFLKELQFVNPVSKSMEIDLKVKYMIMEEENINVIINKFEQDEDRNMIHSGLKILKYDYTGYQSILHYLALHMRYEGNHVTVVELCSVINLILKSLIEVPSKANLVLWIIATNQQSNWLLELILFRLELYLKQILKEEIITNWREYLRKSNKETLMIFSEKIDKEQRLDFEIIDEVLHLLSFIPHRIIALSNLKLSDWKYVLKDSFWIIKVKSIGHWSDEKLREMSFYFMNLENLFGSDMCENIFQMVKNRMNNDEIDNQESTVMTVLRRLTQNEISFVKHLMDCLSKEDINQWGKIIEMEHVSSKEIRNIEQLKELIENDSNTSDIIHTSIDETVMCMKIISFLVKFLMSIIQSKEELEEWIGRILKVYSTNKIPLFCKQETHESNKELEYVQLDRKFKDFLKEMNESLHKEFERSGINARCPKQNTVIKDKVQNELEFLSGNLNEIFLAFVCVSIYFLFNEVKLRDTQLLAILTFLNSGSNILSQVSTGEGKSLIIISVALIKVLSGSKVDIITSNHVLAERDAKAHKSICNLFGIEVGHNCTEKIEERKKTYSNCKIVYGELAYFQRDYLLDKVYNHNVLSDHTFESVIVDEVDSMLLDKGNNVLYLSHEIPGLDKLEPLFVHIWKCLSFPGGPNNSMLHIGQIRNVILHELYEQVQKEDIMSLDNRLEEKHVCQIFAHLQKQNVIDFNGKILQRNLEKLEVDKADRELDEAARNFINEGHLKYLLKKIINRKKAFEVPNYLKQFAENHLNEWIESAINAMNLKINVDYVVDVDRTDDSVDINPNIIIVDRDTGTDMRNSQWDQGLHQFLQLKHGCRISPLSFKAVFISNVKYLLLYTTLYGLSGTLGSKIDRKLLQDTYNVKLVTIPTAKAKVFIQEIPVLCNNREDWSNTIFEEVIQVTATRSALIVCESVKDVVFLKKYFDKSLKNKLPKRKIVTYTRDYEEFLLGKYNHLLEPRQIIISTNLAGRGTDIKLSEELIRTGGLYVCLSFLPSNCRVEEQAFGRAARNGEPGSGRLIFMNPGHSTSSKLIDLVKERDINEVFRINNVERHYKSKIKVEEDLFSEFKNAFSALRESKHPDQIKSILLMTCLSQWAIWLEGEKKSGDQSTLKSLIDNISKLISDDFDSWSNQIQDPFQLTKLGLLYLKQKDYKLAIKLFDKVILTEPVFNEAAYYYRISACSHLQDIESKTIVKDLDVVNQKLKERIESSLLSGKFIDMMKDSIKKNVLQIDSFQEQQITVCKTYEMFINSIQNIIGSSVTPDSFLGSNPPLGISEERVSHHIFNDLIEHKVLNITIKDDKFDKDLHFLAEFGVNPEKIISMLMMLNQGKHFTRLTILNSIRDSLSLQLPSRELFWSKLIHVGVLKNEVELAYFNFESLKEVDPSFANKIEKLSSNETPSKDQISLYTFEELGMSNQDSRKYCFSCSEILNAVGKDRLEFFKRENVMILNKRATLVQPVDAGKLKFELFDSITQEDFFKVGIPSEIAKCIIEDLVDCNVISLEENVDTPQYSLIIPCDEIHQIELKTYKAYLNDVKQLLSHCFAFSIAFKKLLHVLPSCEGNYSELFLPLQTNLDQRLLDELVSYGIIEIRTNSEEVKRKCLREIYFNFATKEKFIEIFSKVYGFRKSKKIVNELIKSECLKKKVFKNNEFRISYDVDDKKEIKLRCLPETLKADSETIKLVLLNQIHLYLSIKFINNRLQLLNGNMCNVETGSLHLTSLETMLNQRKIPTTEVHVFSLNGFDELIHLEEKKYTTRMICNTFCIMTLGLAEITAGACIEIFNFGNPLGIWCISQGIDDIIFATSCAYTGHFSWSDYRTNKLISLIISSFTFYKAIQSLSAISSSSFGAKTAGISLSTLKEKCCSLVSKTKNVFSSMFKQNVTVSKKEFFVDLSKRVVVSVGQGVSAGVTMSIMDHTIASKMEDLAGLLTDLIHSDIERTVINHAIVQDAKELYYTQGGKASEKILADIVMKVTLEYQAKLETANLNMIKTLIKHLMFKEFRDLIGKGNQNSLIGLSQFCLAAINLNKSISSAWEKYKFITTIVSNILDKAHQKLQTEKNKLALRRENISSSPCSGEERFISDICEIMQTVIRNTLKDYIRVKILLPLVEFTESHFINYSFRFIGHVGKSFLSDEETCQFSHKEKNYDLQNYKSETGKNSKNFYSDFNNLSSELMKTRKIKAVMGLNKVNTQNAPINLNCIQFCFKIIPLLLQQEGIIVPPIKFEFEENGKKQMFELGNTTSKTRVVHISQDEDFISNLINNKLLVKDLFEFLNKSFLKSNPEFQHLSAAIMYETFIRVMDNLSRSHKSSEGDEEFSFPPPCRVNQLNNDTERKNPYQHLHCEGSWKFNPFSDIDLREKDQAVNLNNAQHHIVKGFKSALRKINYHIHAIQECLQSFDLCLDDFSVTKHHLAPPPPENTLEIFHCFPVQYELVVPVMLTGCNRHVNFSILLRLVNQKPVSKPQPNCPNGPHIFYEINPSKEVKFINKGLRGHILLNIDCLSTSYSIKECHVAGELIVTSFESKSKRKKDRRVVIITDSRFKNIHKKHMKLPKNWYDCLAFPSWNDPENIGRKITTSLNQYQNIKCVVLFIGNDILKKHNIDGNELVNCLISVIEEIHMRMENVHIVLYSLLYVKHPAMKYFWKIFKINTALENFIIKEELLFIHLKNTNEIVGPQDLCRNGIDLKVSGYKKLGQHLSQICEDTVNMMESSTQDYLLKRIFTKVCNITFRPY